MQFSYREISKTQKFLRSEELVKKLLKLTSIPNGAIVLDTGAGKGIISKVLCDHVGKNGTVYAVEIDPVLARNVKTSLKRYDNLKVFNQDIFDFDWKILSNSYYIFSNIPFNQTSLIINKILAQYPKVLGCWVVVEKEAAQMYGGQLCGAKHECYKSLTARYRYELAIKHEFTLNDFKPSLSKPPVFLEIKPKLNEMISLNEYALFENFIKKVSKDRVGEGQWKKLFTKKQINRLCSDAHLVYGKGIKSQRYEGIVSAFDLVVYTL